MAADKLEASIAMTILRSFFTPLQYFSPKSCTFLYL